MIKKRDKSFIEEKIALKSFNDPKELVTEITNYEEKEMTTLTDKEIKFYEKQKVCHICKGYFCTNEINEKEFKHYHKVRDHCHYTGEFRGAAHNT